MFALSLLRLIVLLQTIFSPGIYGAQYHDQSTPRLNDGFKLQETKVSPHLPGHQPALLQLSLLDSSHDFSTLSHPAFPRHSVRIKHTEFCDPTVRAYTGYIDIEARHLFFFYFESRNDPAHDDVLLWLNGGPGGSSTLGMLMELGPCTIDGANQTKFNPYGWNDRANVLFLEQPVGVGYSYADYGETVTTTEEAAKDVAAFMAIFFESIEGLSGRAFSIAGESYGGRYVPLFAAEIYDQNQRLEAAGMNRINLSSVMIGNGIVDPSYMSSAYHEIQCTNTSGSPPVQSIAACVRMKQALPRCEKAWRDNCIDSFDEMNCRAARTFCSTELMGPFESTGRSMYDIRTECIGQVQDTLCYPITINITAYLDSPSTRALLGIPESFPPYKPVSWRVNSAFDLSGDELRPSHLHLAALLDRGVRVLVYAGMYDMICNWVGNERMARALEWNGQAEFGRSELRKWIVDGEEEGLVKQAGNLAFVAVKDAGHMVPYDRPRQSLALVNTWLSGTPFEGR
ncbi:hypothetical protein PLICRDRAFT_41030 [Plicaturopsis crispa FD-325 SS-3]|nr:hypothetical protein PLICRDRAFT_41030 [Plicaturopsis crispa FD-325 SS-3]